MSSSSPEYILRGLSIYKLLTFIPKQWKNVPVSNGREFMINSIFYSLKSFASHGQLSKAFEAFSLVQLRRSYNDSFDLIVQSISILLVSCTTCSSLPSGKQLHGRIISSGLEEDSILVPKLVTFYSSFKLLAEAHTLVENSNLFHPCPWNLLITSYVRNELHESAILAYKQMLSKGVRPDNFTFPSILKACGETQNLGFGLEVHKCINSWSNQWSLFVQNALISMYGRCGELDTARNLFDNMLDRDAVSWNSMISCYASKGMWKEAFELFDIMQSKCLEINIVTWNIIAGGCLRLGKFTRALKLLSQMRNFGIHLDDVAMIIGLGACSHIGAIRLGKEIHGFTIRHCYHKSSTVQNALLTMYARCKDIMRAYILFRLNDDKSIITWNSMLSGLSHVDRVEDALRLFREFLLFGVEPNYVTFASILPLCARVADLQHGREFHCYITKRQDFQDYLLLWNALVDMYARSGKVIEAKRVFDSLSKKDEVTYTSLIAGYGMQGEGRKALRLFEEMKSVDIKPDHITMVAVLSACSHSGLVKQGEVLFAEMQSVHGLSPHLEHYACMADLFGRVGLLDRAKEIITRMPYRPTSAMWATLIGACCIHRNTDIGEWAAEKLLEMKPEHSGYYVLIANMYAAAGSWSKLAKIRTLMRDYGVAKAPGCSWVEVGSEFVSFLVGDTSNPQALESKHLLDDLNDVMKHGTLVMTDDYDIGNDVF
ncbi:pentatricopeptide repeat-containing protein At1g71490 isoform X1 [Cucurbita maxima]|uniref:Pentatricopeptide repeat-containing protein At1g71490 isoform X1 n=1 Tax=Cucurbita maxima TaxID=3661 RepID=A0A6J1I8V4_CUCMA|nr:pentatricopeptide repeat-containing protein At1g71490 isoform X1 [Cucurbita maxima]XP_022973518.1 pentatricopeptide repeat-containing protein At1g71490 isoform X1 [Cucurbita maxima]XP_022973519.1 pentatricopeptide repeat-containing protein At1g71490 isoform X1 [Cucurbita maxima]XP_022973520.1 pentatricopeptide repeat-containing protein At1g71490 isoform X1 [Cucurbita maxima]